MHFDVSVWILSLVSGFVDFSSYSWSESEGSYCLFQVIFWLFPSAGFTLFMFNLLQR